MKSAVLLALAVALALAAPVVEGAPVPLATARAFIERMKANGRAEAEFERLVRIAGAEPPEPVRGKLALENPGLARIEFPSTGECITLRADGGEWLQPQLEQLRHGDARHDPADHSAVPAAKLERDLSRVALRTLQNAHGLRGAHRAMPERVTAMAAPDESHGGTRLSLRAGRRITRCG